MKHDLTPHDLPLADLTLLPGNPRQGDIGAVSESMRVNGVYQPIIVNKGTKTGRPNEIIAGNHRAQAAKALGHKTIPAIVLDLTDEEAKRIALADNRTSDLADYDNQALLLMLQSLPDLAGTGYDGDDLDALLADIESEAPTALTDPDDAPTVPEKPISRDGDLWELGPHRLAVGSGTDPAVVALATGGATAAAYITDPPYVVSYTGRTKDALTIQNDDMEDAAFENFLEELFTAAAGQLEAGSGTYVFYASSRAVPFINALNQSGLLFKQNLVWVKNTLILGRQDYNWQHEPILYGWKAGAAHRWYGDFDKTTLVQDDAPDVGKMKKDDLAALVKDLLDGSDVLRFAKPARNGEHPTMKPVDLLSRLITNSTRRGQIILDTCAGSGSIMIAAHHTDRVAHMVELDPRYADVICRRWQEHTGQQPRRDGIPVDFTKDH